MWYKGREFVCAFPELKIYLLFLNVKFCIFEELASDVVRRECF